MGAATMASSSFSIQSARVVVNKELDQYLEMCDKLNESEEMMPVSKISTFFRDNMWKLPNLSKVYRQRAGKPNSSGCLENDFCAAAKEWRPHRVTMDSRYADAQLFCNCNLALIESLGKTNIKSYKSEEDVDKHMPPKGFGAGMYEEEDNAQHESGEVAMSRAFARAQNPTARDVTPALACDPEVNHNDFMDNDMEEDDGDL